jgi:phosphonate transport system substrate-binding protein
MTTSLFSSIRFCLPLSVSTAGSQRVEQLQTFLSAQLSQDVEVTVAGSYEQLMREVSSGRTHLAWAPPFICARLEAAGIRVVLRQVRGGVSTYRAALICHQRHPLTLSTLQGTRAVWSERDSVGGCLLAMAFLKENNLEPASVFSAQTFAGSYRKALKALIDSQADVTSVFSDDTGRRLGVEELWPEVKDQFRVIALTDVAPNDGIVVSHSATPQLLADVERVLSSMHLHSAGQSILASCFRAERFEPAPRLGYRALYRVALASL